MILTKREIKFFKEASNVSFHHPEDHAPFMVLDTKTFEQNNELITIRPLNSSINKGKSAKGALEMSNVNAVWQSICRFLKAGDDFALQFMADAYTTEQLQVAGFCVDAMFVRIAREDKNGKAVFYKFPVIIQPAFADSPWRLVQGVTFS